MKIYDIYLEYKELNKEYVSYIEDKLTLDIDKGIDETIVTKLTDFKIRFEELKVKSDEIEVLPEDEDNLRDLKYLIVDGIFISYDLINFYANGHIERFKMRITNYINKVNRAEHNFN